MALPLKTFIRLLETKYNEWYGTDQAKYLRPETLFGTKFESYLNQKAVEKKKKRNIMLKLQEYSDNIHCDKCNDTRSRFKRLSTLVGVHAKRKI